MSERTEYVTYRTVLVPDVFGNRRKVIDIWGDVVYIDTVNTDADISRLYIGVDDKDLLPASLSPVIDLKPSYFQRVKVEWDKVNDNKTLSIIIGREASLRIEPPRAVDIVAIHADVAKDSTLLSIRDVVSNILAKRIRWGRDVEPTWIYGPEFTAPPANTILVSKTVAVGKLGYIYGLFISASEANVFKLTWTSFNTEYSISIPLGGAGALMATVESPINEGLPADGDTNITIRNLRAGIGVYQAGILVLEV